MGYERAPEGRNGGVCAFFGCEPFTRLVGWPKTTTPLQLRNLASHTFTFKTLFKVGGGDVHSEGRPRRPAH